MFKFKYLSTYYIGYRDITIGDNSNILYLEYRYLYKTNYSSNIILTKTTFC